MAKRTWINDYQRFMTKFLKVDNTHIIKATITHDINFQQMKEEKFGQDVRLTSVNRLLCRVWYNLQVSRPFNHYETKIVQKLEASQGTF